MAEIDLMRDVLDKALFDRDGCPMGRVDSIPLSISDSGQPVIAMLNTGGSSPWRRLHPTLEHFALAVRRHIGPHHKAAFSIAWSDVIHLGLTVRVGIHSRGSPALRWERWLDTHLIDKIPGAGKARHSSPEHRYSKDDSVGHAAHSNASAHTMTIEYLLGKKVHDSDGALVGRIEEIRAERGTAMCRISEYHVGSYALMERLSASHIGRAMLHALPRHGGYHGCRVPWKEMDLSDPEHPKALVKRDQLRRLRV